MRTNGNDPVTGVILDDFGKMIVGDGLTIRVWLAGLAMQGLLSNPSIIDVHNADTKKWIADHAAWQADALLDALNKED